MRTQSARFRAGRTAPACAGLGFSAILAAALSVGLGGARASGQCTPDPAFKAMAPIGAPQDRLGSWVSISGDVAVAGALSDDVAFPDSGSAQVYRYNGAAWQYQTTLVQPDPSLADQFGSSVAVSGDLIAVGAQWDDDKGTDSGSIYVFRYNGASWVYEAKLTGSDGQPADQMGFAVAVVSGALTGGEDIIIAGAITDDDMGMDSGSAYIFRKTGGSWVQDIKLLPPDLLAQDRLGASVGLTAGPGGTFAIVTAWLQDDVVRGVDSGTAYVYRFESGAWVPDGKLVAPDGIAFDWFGVSAAIAAGAAGEFAVVGAQYRDDAGVDAGTVYVFRRIAGSWVFDAKLTADSVSAGDNFGRSVAVLAQGPTGSPDTNIIVVGARFDDYDTVTNSGSAYLFRYRGLQWTQDATLRPADAATDKESGTSVALTVDGTGQPRIISGAPRDATWGANAGAAYIFTVLCPAVCPGDLNGDGFVDFSDYLTFLNLYDAADPSVDFNGDGIVDFSDYLEFLNRFDLGC